MILKANSETFLEHNNKNSKLRLTEMERESEHLALKIKTLDIPVKSDYMYFTFLVKEHKKMIAIYKSEAAQVQKGVETSWSTASIKIKPEYQRLPMCIRVFQSGFLNDKISGDANFSRESLVAGKVIKLSKSGSKSNHDKGAINILKADFRDRYLQAPSQTISSVSESFLVQSDFFGSICYKYFKPPSIRPKY
ncbi:hypothetical protein MHBO_003688 [Bonamia ostreae]|uniref:Ribosomal protein L5 n=1 Tax=Bonamia ostreae TaxID=126728 RepID=A0ABV2AR69_9EUKA